MSSANDTRSENVAEERMGFFLALESPPVVVAATAEPEVLLLSAMTLLWSVSNRVWKTAAARLWSGMGEKSTRVFCALAEPSASAETFTPSTHAATSDCSDLSVTSAAVAC